VLLIPGGCRCTVCHSKDLTQSEKNVYQFFAVRSIFFESSTGAATRLLQRKKLCQSTIFFAGGAAIACLPLQPYVRTTHHHLYHGGKLFRIQHDYFVMSNESLGRLRLSACSGLRHAQAQAVLRRILYWVTILRDFPERHLGYTSHNKNGFI
jgi:hypothetical protein